MVIGEQQSDGAATYFAPAARAGEEEVRREVHAANADPLLKAVVECVDGLLLVVNEHRQVLLVNERALEVLGISDQMCLAGLRPGEIINCVHAHEGPGGCGTARVCAHCGAVQTILQSLRTGEPAEAECLATVTQEGQPASLEFRVRATPVEGGGLRLIALVLSDISSQKRREALERVFFHDIMNTISGLVGWGNLLQDPHGLDPAMIAGRVAVLSQRLAEDVREQRRLLEAERGALQVRVSESPVAGILAELRDVFEAHDSAAGKHLRIEPADPGESVHTDAGLLLRVLVNMVKNAFEASSEGDAVRVWYEREDGRQVFRVHNAGAMPEDVQLRIFNRSFSTKGTPGRGLGTYSMKLFGERYLGGRVGFVSNEQDGTTFSIELGPAP